LLRTICQQLFAGFPGPAAKNFMGSEVIPALIRFMRKESGLAQAIALNPLAN